MFYQVPVRKTETQHKHTVSQKLQGQNQEAPRTDDTTMVTRMFSNSHDSKITRPQRLSTR